MKNLVFITQIVKYTYIDYKKTYKTYLKPYSIQPAPICGSPVSKYDSKAAMS